MPLEVDNTHNGLPLDKQVSYTELEPTISEWAKSITPTRAQVIDYVASLFPFSRWITYYNLQWLAGDLVAGMVLAASL
jgi:sodium-independent sulfate anion transporter 11